MSAGEGAYRAASYGNIEWFATAYMNDRDAYYQNFSGSIVTISGETVRFNGFSVRCLGRKRE